MRKSLIMASRGWAKNKKGYLVNSEGKTARQVRQEKYAAKKAEAKAKASGTSTSLSVSGGGGESPATGRSRLGKLVDSIEANQKADVQNYRRVLKVADSANAMAGGKAGGQASGRKDAGSSRLCVIIFAYEIVKCLLGKTFRAILLKKLSV